MISNNITSHIARAGWITILAVPLLLLSVCPVWSAIEEQPLTDGDCIKCHKQPTNEINALGGSHKTEMGCLGCHDNHPPMGEARIPECSECHSSEDAPHFALQNCDQCHSPHAPVITDFDSIGTVKTACLSCHEDIGAAMTEVPSLHAEQDCSECHSQHGTEKGQFMTCLECHEGHSEEMTYNDCLSCHNPHQPTAYIWDDNTRGALCSACHADEVSTLNAQGGAHASDITCQECHQRHPPAEKDVIPSCADCHDPDDSAHYKIDNCSACHNPHKPMDIDLSAVSPIKPVCLSCHTTPGVHMERHPSAHAEMDCNECHQQHGEYQECLECHSGHSDAMNYADCLRCHQPHEPTHLQFGVSGVKPKLCGSCHSGQHQQLKDNPSRHAELQCIYCHKRTHKVILSCDNCHGQPHDSSIHQQFSECSTCHKGPHNLRN